MSFLSKIFGSKKSVQPTVQQEKKRPDLATLSAQDLVEIINSTNQSVDTKLGAIQRLPYDQALIDLTNTSSSPQIQSAAAKRIAKLLDNDEITFEKLTADFNNEQSLSITGYCKNSDYITRLIEQNQDENQLTELAISGSTSKARQAAAAKVFEFDNLQKIVKEIKTKDKNVYKIAKEKIDKARAEQKAKEAKLAKLQSICETMEKLVNTIDLATFDTRLKQIQGQWTNEIQGLTENSFESRYQEAEKQCIERQTAMQREIAEKEAQKLAISNAQKVFSTILSELHQFIADIYSTKDIDVDFANTSNHFVQTKQAEWNDALQHTKPSKAQSNQYQQSIDSIGSLIINISQNGSLEQKIEALKAAQNEVETAKTLSQEILNLLSTSEQLPEALTPEIVTTARKSVAEYKAQLKEQKDQEHAHIRQLSGLIRKTNSVVAQGNLRQASGMRKAIDEKLETIPNLPARFTEQIEELDAEINKLQDYRNFATEPKKLELIAEMEKLAEKVKADSDSEPPSLDAEDLADQIKKLQSDWKELVYGGKDTQPELWEKFHALSQVAYEPCKSHFNEKSEQRQQNLEKRKTLLEQLTDYKTQYNWEKADWKEVEKVLRTAKQEWSSYSPVERAANAPLQKSFNALLQELQGFIDKEYEKNKTAKENIISSAEKLAEMEDTQAAIQQVKQLQAQWKNCGRTWQKEENKLWKNFRTYCDAVFDKKQQESDAFKAELNNNKTQAEELCKKVESIAKLNNQELLEKRTEVDELSNQFSEITPLPRNSERSIKDRFKAALESYEDAIQQFRLNQEKQAWVQVFEVKNAINSWQNQVLDKEDESTIEKALQKAQEAFEKVEKWPAGSKTIMEKQLKQTVSDDTRKENEQALRLLCIQLETTLGAETPKEDQALRMEYQVNRLKEGMTGSASLSKEEGVNSISLGWLAAEPVLVSVYKKLSGRFGSIR